jgi:hypothetical protein
LEREDGDKKVAHNIATFLFVCLNNDDRKELVNICKISNTK